MLAGGNAEGEVREDRVVLAVGERHLLEDHLTGAAALPPTGHGPCRALLQRQLHDLNGLLQQLTNPLHRREAALDLGEALRQLTQGIEQALRIQDESGEGAESHHTGGHHPAPQGQHHGDGGEGHPFDQGGDGRVVEDRAVHRRAVGLGGAGEAGAVERLPAEHLHHLQTLEVFLEVGIELAELLANPIVGLAVALLQPEDRQGHRHLGGQQQQAQPWLDRDHRDRDHQQGHQVGQDPHRTAAEHLGQGIHVAGEPGEQFAHRRAVVEAQGQIQRVGEQVVADACGEPLAHRLHVEALHALQSKPHQHGH